MRTDPALLVRMLLASFILGAALGAAKDLLCFFCLIPVAGREKVKKAERIAGSVIRIVQDFLACLAAGFAVTVVLFYYNDGKPRGFAFLALLLGFLGYCILFGRPFKKISEKLAGKIRKGICLVFLRVTHPIVLFARWCAKTVWRPMRFCIEKKLQRRIKRYDAVRYEELKKTSEKGFVKIEYGNIEIS